MLFVVYHYAFATDDLERTFSIVEANTPAAALEKYNKLAKERSAYPYLWNQASIDNVYKTEIIK